MLKDRSGDDTPTLAIPCSAPFEVSIFILEYTKQASIEAFRESESWGSGVDTNGESNVDVRFQNLEWLYLWIIWVICTRILSSLRHAVLMTCPPDDCLPS